MAIYEYIWVDKSGRCRSKVKVADDITEWNFDGSSTGQNIGNDTEVILKPVFLRRSPFPTEDFLVLCELDLPESIKDDPLPGFNTRRWASTVAEKYKDREAWFGCEQEYTILDPVTKKPYGMEENNFTKQGDFYCAVGYPYSQQSELVREHFTLCKEMGLKICGFNAEVMAGQWEFQIGPADLLTVADDMIFARYILYRLSTKYKVEISFEPKLLKEWNGSGCHINFSTKEMRDEHGIIHINSAVDKLEKDHPKILGMYGDNSNRLTGEHETSSADRFTTGIGTRNTSIRIPSNVVADQRGYFEDRRPASDIDPYLALGSLLQVIVSANIEDDGL